MDRRPSMRAMKPPSLVAGELFDDGGQRVSTVVATVYTDSLTTGLDSPRFNLDLDEAIWALGVVGRMYTLVLNGDARFKGTLIPPINSTKNETAFEFVSDI